MTEHFANTLLRDGKADPCGQASRADPSPALESCTAAAKGEEGTRLERQQLSELARLEQQRDEKRGEAWLQTSGGGAD